MTKTIFEYDIATGKYNRGNLIQDAQAALQQMDKTLKALDASHRTFEATRTSKSLQDQANSMLFLHSSLVSLNDSFVGLLYLSNDTETSFNVRDKQFVSGMKLELDMAQSKWSRLVSQASRIKATFSPKGFVAQMITGR